MAKRKKKKKKVYVWRTWHVKASRELLERKDGRKGFSDSLDVQISVRVKVPVGVQLSARVIEEAVKYRCATGRDPKGFTIKITRWRNPDRKKGSLKDVYKTPGESKGGRGWREYGTQADRFGTLARALQGSRMEFESKERRTPRRKMEPVLLVRRRRRGKGKGKRKLPHAAKRVPNPRTKTKVGKIRQNKKGVARHHKAKGKTRTR